MSHLNHINNYKIALIKEGITNPETQIALVRTAYICAFIQLFKKKHIHHNDRVDVMNYVLSYWNETFPVNGNSVISGVKSFYERLDSELSTVKSPILLSITRDETIEKLPNYYDVEGYTDLIDILVYEASYKYDEKLKG